VENAVQHGTPPIGLVGTVTDDEVRIQVSDAGHGIPAGLEDVLFERYSPRGPQGGTGLGLFLVREIARRHGGDASYRPPADDSPATFEITLPRSREG
jgi:signal transduction histidine kinase